MSKSVQDLIANGARFCYTIPSSTPSTPGSGFRVSLVVENVQGHFPTGNTPEGGDVAPWYWGPTRADAEAICATHNATLGHADHDVAMIIVSSMGGKVNPQHLKKQRSRRSTAR